MNIGFLAELAYEYIRYGQHVSEIYSPPRVAKLAQKFNLRPGFSIDIRENDPDDNMPWDLNNFEKRAKLKFRVEHERPLLLIGSPPCTVFSSLFASNVSRMIQRNPTELRRKIREGVSNLLFCVELYNIHSI